MSEFTEKHPCEMSVSIAYHRNGEWNGEPVGCVTDYKGELGYGIKETLDEYAGYAADLFYEGAMLPKKNGIYKFTGVAEVCMIGGSDEPVLFKGEFELTS